MGFYEKRILPHLLNAAMRRPEHLPYRKRVVSQAEGRVLEIGLGAGLNLQFYTSRATAMIAIEPHPQPVALAAIKNSPVPVHVVSGSAEAIPLEAAAIDTIVSTWNLCSIADAGAALAELRRVLKPGGRLLFVEHGLAPDETVRRWQTRLNPLWKRIAGGCNMHRPIPNLIENAGWEIDHLESGYMMTGPKVLTFTYEGAAVPR